MIAALEPRVVAIVDELVDGMLEKGTVDLAADLAEPLPAAAQRLEAFDQRLGDLRQRHAKKRAFLQRLERADLGAGPPHGGAQR